MSAMSYKVKTDGDRIVSSYGSFESEERIPDFIPAKVVKGWLDAGLLDEFADNQTDPNGLTLEQRLALEDGPGADDAEVTEIPEDEREDSPELHDVEIEPGRSGQFEKPVSRSGSGKPSTKPKK